MKIRKKLIAKETDCSVGDLTYKMVVAVDNAVVNEILHYAQAV